MLFYASTLSSQCFELSDCLDGYSHMTGKQHISPLEMNWCVLKRDREERREQDYDRKRTHRAGRL